VMQPREDAMKKVTTIAVLVIAFLGLIVQIHESPRAGGRGSPRTANGSTAQSTVIYWGKPRFAPVIGTSIAYATNTRQVIFKSGDAFYFRLAPKKSTKSWLISGSAEGPWAPAPSVPENGSVIVCAQIGTDPYQPYQLCTLPWRK
jgi:hypothetical protein